MFKVNEQGQTAYGRMGFKTKGAAGRQAQSSQGAVTLSDPGISTDNLGAITIDGINKTFIAPHHASMEITGAITVMACVNGASQTDKVIASRYAGGTTERCWVLRSVGNKIGAVISADGNSTNIKRFVSSVVVFDSSDQHVAMVFDPTLAVNDQLKLYIAGTLDSSPTRVTNVDLVGGMFSSSQSTHIGTWAAGGTANYFAGELDGVGVFNVALDATEIAEAYGSGTVINLTTHSRASTLISYAEFEITRGDNATTVRDTSGVGEDFVCSNIVLGDYGSPLCV